jgi:hypothetical protein
LINISGGGSAAIAHYSKAAGVLDRVKTGREDMMVNCFLMCQFDQVKECKIDSKTVFQSVCL